MKRKTKSKAKPKGKTKQSRGFLTWFETHKLKVFWSVLFVLACALTLQPLSDVDIWWHIGMGRGMIAEMGLPLAADYYWSPVAYDVPPDLRYTWLGDVFFALVFLIGGDVGLQLLALAAVGLCIWFLWDMSGRVMSGRNLLILCLFMAGTYQMHIVRNALFGLPATVFLLWLWWRIHTHGEKYHWWFFPPLLAIWSCLHGTYLFGFGLLALLVAGDILDRIRLNQPISRQDFLLRAGILGLSYGAISLYNPLTISLTQSVLSLITDLPLWLLITGFCFLIFFLVLAIKMPENRKPRVLGTTLVVGILAGGGFFLVRHFRRYFGDATYLKTLNLRAYQSSVDTETLGFLGRLKHGLNNTFWKSENQQMASIDFFSPFDFLGDIYVWASLTFLLVSIVLFTQKANRRFIHLLPYAAVVILGLGYLRTIGFISIFVACFLLITGYFSNKKVDTFGWWVSLGGTLLILLGLVGQFNPLGLNSDHQLRLGKANFFPEALSQVILETYPERLVFTTIENGGFVLNSWYPEKKVFMDGFFRPHEGQTYLDYSQALEAKNPDFLYERYGVTLALVGMRDSAWFAVFNTAKGWVPRMADTGGILFERISSSTADHDFELFIRDHDWASAEPYLRRLIALRLYDASFKLLSEGFMVQAVTLMETESQLMSNIRAAAPARVKEPFEKSIQHLQAQYGLSNNPLIRTEFELSEAVQNDDFIAILRHGEAIVENQPERDDVWQALIATAEKLERPELANNYRRKREQYRETLTQEP